MSKANRDLAIRRMQEIFEFAQTAQADNSLYSELIPRIEHMKKVMASFENSHEKIIAKLNNEQEIEHEDIFRRNFDSQCYAIKKIYSDLNERKLTLSKVVNNSSDVRSPNVKLPKINLPVFDGNFKTWPSFFDLYNTLVHENQLLSKIEKFQYLLTSLNNEPFSLLKSFPLSESNYDSAYATLVQRYQNKRKLAFLYWEEIVNAKLTSDSPCSLRKLLDIFNENLSILGNLNLPVKEWDFVLFYLLLTKLDRNSRQRFELENTSTVIPSFETLKTFIENQCKAFELVDSHTSKGVSSIKRTCLPKYSNAQNQNPKSLSFVVNAEKTSNQKCVLCNDSHVLYRCPSFIDKSPLDRYNFVRNSNMCLNCLSSEHFVQNCHCKRNCRTCGYKHHSLLHYLDKQQKVDPAKPSTSNSNSVNLSVSTTEVLPEQPNEVQVLTNTLSTQTTVILSTALVKILDSYGNYQIVRALIDQGSQANFITENCLRRLGLSRSHLSVPISGVNQMSSLVSKGITTSKIKPMDQSDPVFPFEAIVIPSICKKLPSLDIPRGNWEYISNLKLADPNFNKAHGIDILIGAELYPLVLQDGRLVRPSGQPSALSTVFGWVLTGKVDCQNQSIISSFCVAIDSPLDQIVKRFWELEQVPQITSSSPDDIQCEEIFKSNFHRDNSGRYIVSLPFRGPDPRLGDSRSGALRRFFSLERRFTRNHELATSYKGFMQDYLDCNHMSVVPPPEDPTRVYYIPHHCVFKPESLTTKLRVVFDASAKSTSGLSLNDSLFIGPKLQGDLVSILLRFRLYSVVFTADIRQMYRQILIDNKHRDYQRILWRFSEDEPVQEYCLNTVTYGVSSAPFLAIRTLVQLAQDEQLNYPLASKALSTDMYVDDLVTGSNSVEEALVLKEQFIGLFEQGGFKLLKWASNHPSLLSFPSNLEKQNSLSFDIDSFVKILGLQWQPSADTFSYRVEPIKKNCTKRTILSELARVFDPMGFLSPFTIIAKLLIQTLWTLGIGWDENPPPEILVRWERYKSQLPLLSSIKLKRCITVDSFISCELHGFADSSESSYAASVYLRFLDLFGNYSTNLVCAKSRVAPLKKLSIPRLELCAAVLLSDLIHFVMETYLGKLPISKVFAWSDSTVTLSWIKSPSYRWKTFVANRVAHIQERVSPDCWHHVRSSDNPADCATRGLFPLDLIEFSLWWYGPTWLSTSQENWPSTSDKIYPIEVSSELASEGKKIVLSTFFVIDQFDVLIEKYSSLSTIVHVVAYCRRFIHNVRKHSVNKISSFAFLELNDALLTLVRHVQHTVFQDDISKLKRNQLCSHSLRKLSVFLDENEVLRVGGRLANSSLPFNTKHPALLPREHRLTSLIIKDTHIKYLHPGPQSLQYLLCQQFWILSAKRAIRKVLSNCYKCFRTNPPSVFPLMGNLPSTRVSQVKPFFRVGVDYGGPFTVTLGKHRGAKSYKAYICLFVCFATKAIHLELASDLSSECFLAALRRFVSRRGRCSHIHSDCGTNFVGAYRQILEYMQQAANQDAIQWHFNPPSAPHFGGLWEAGIKSVKNHLSRIVGEQVLTYEEFYTILVQIEAVLNSRPLCPLSSDPNDLAVLTPGHFLTLEPLTAPPSPDVSNLKLNRLSRWQLLQRIHSDFWKRWNREYLHTLHQRSKWSKNPSSINLESLVLIKDDQLPPLRWRLGRVVEVHPGKDGIVRVATVRTSTGLISRPVVKLCPLPVNEN